MLINEDRVAKTENFAPSSPKLLFPPSYKVKSAKSEMLAYVSKESDTLRSLCETVDAQETIGAN